MTLHRVISCYISFYNVILCYIASYCTMFSHIPLYGCNLYYYVDLIIFYHMILYCVICSCITSCCIRSYYVIQRCIVLRYSMSCFFCFFNLFCPISFCSHATGFCQLSSSRWNYFRIPAHPCRCLLELKAVACSLYRWLIPRFCYRVFVDRSPTRDPKLVMQPHPSCLPTIGAQETT